MARITIMLCLLLCPLAWSQTMVNGPGVADDMAFNLWLSLANANPDVFNNVSGLSDTDLSALQSQVTSFASSWGTLIANQNAQLTGNEPPAFLQGQATARQSAIEGEIAQLQSVLSSAGWTAFNAFVQNEKNEMWMNVPSSCSKGMCFNYGYYHSISTTSSKQFEDNWQTSGNTSCSSCSGIRHTAQGEFELKSGTTAKHVSPYTGQSVSPPTQYINSSSKFVDATCILDGSCDSNSYDDYATVGCSGGGNGGDAFDIKDFEDATVFGYNVGHTGSGSSWLITLENYCDAKHTPPDANIGSNTPKYIKDSVWTNEEYELSTWCISATGGQPWSCFVGALGGNWGALNVDYVWSINPPPPGACSYHP